MKPTAPQTDRYKEDAAKEQPEEPMMTRPQVHAFRIETMQAIDAGEFANLADYKNARAWTFACAVLLADMGVGGFIAEHREQYMGVLNAWAAERIAVQPSR